MIPPARAVSPITGAASVEPSLFETCAPTHTASAAAHDTKSTLCRRGPPERPGVPDRRAHSSQYRNDARARIPVFMRFCGADASDLERPSPVSKVGLSRGSSSGSPGSTRGPPPTNPSVKPAARAAAATGCRRDRAGTRSP